MVNKSINKTTKYKFQDQLGDREERENISRKFNIKYLLAVLNSGYVKKWMDKTRRHKVSIYPDDWKQLPIVPLTLVDQQPFVEKVDAILSEYTRHVNPPLPEAVQRVKDLERELDEMVARLYGVG